MDAVAPLAGQLVQILTPFLPYLVKAGEGVGTALQDQGYELAKTVWDRLGTHVDAKPAAHEAAADVAALPSDEDAQAALRVQIRKLLVDEPDLRKELEGLLKAGQGSVTNVTVSGDRSVGIGGNMSGGTIITGDQSGSKAP